MSDLNRMISETYEFNVVDVDFTCDENNLPTNSNYFFQQQQQQQQQKEKQPNARKSSSSTSSSRPNQSILSCSQNNVQIDATIISANTNCPTSSSSDGENFFNRTLDDDPNASVNTVTHKYHNNKQPVEHYSNNLNPNSESTLTPTTATTSPNQYGYNLLSSTVNRMDDKEAVISRMNKKASYFDLDNTRRGRNGRKDDDETLPENSVLEANNQQLTTALNTTGCRSSVSCESSAICDTTNITTAAPLDDEDDEDQDESVSLSTTAANNAALASCMTMATTANTTTVKRDHFKKQKQSVVSVVEKCETTKPREKKEQKFHRTRLLIENCWNVVSRPKIDNNVNQSLLS